MLSNKCLAPNADVFKTAGPLIPQWVINKGPECLIFVASILTEALFATTPIRSVMLLLGILKVNKDGTGSIIFFWMFFIQSKPLNFGDPPVAIITLSKKTSWLFITSKNWFSIFSILEIIDCNSNFTSNLLSSFNRQSTIDWDWLETGNTLLSDSVFKVTPLDSNQSNVSLVEKYEKGFLRNFCPLG